MINLRLNKIARFIAKTTKGDPVINIRTNAMYRYLVLLSISAALGFEAWSTLFNNFAVEKVGLEGYQIGMIQSIREIPGFLTFLVVLALIYFREHRLASFSIIVFGIGMAATGLLPSYYGLIFTVMIMSLGFHYFWATCDSLTMQYFDKKTSPLVFGKLNSLAAITNVCAGILIYFAITIINYTQIYLLVGCFMLMIGLWGLRQDPSIKEIIPQHAKIVFRRKYWLYYFLTFMAGARRQIFMAFAVFLMVKKFNFSVQEVTTLFVINNIMNYFLYPIIGRSIARFGERKILSIEYFSLIFVFLAYATIQIKWLIIVLYMLDQFFYNFHIAIQTYFHKIADPKDIASNVSISFTINHIAAVILPALGGLLWVIDYRIPFIGGAVFSLISLFAVQRIRTSVPV